MDGGKDGGVTWTEVTHGWRGDMDGAKDGGDVGGDT